MKRKKDFDCGYACALATLISSHGIDTPIREAFYSNFSSIADAKRRGVDEYDLEIFRRTELNHQHWKNGRTK